MTMTTTHPRDIAIDTLADALGVERFVAWETIKDHANVYGRRTRWTTDRAHAIAKAMWLNDQFVWTKANLRRFVTDATARYEIDHDRYEHTGEICEHPMCEQFHKNTGCPTPVRTGWYIIDRTTGHRAQHADDEYPTRRAAIAAHNAGSTEPLAR